MFDLHTHIIPDLDDGACNLDEALEMIRRATAAGTSYMAATPHYIEGRYRNYRQKILDKFELLKQRVIREGTNITLIPGSEVMIIPELPQLVEKGEILTLNDANQYLLIELPFMEIPSYTEQVIFELQLKGITPIIAHPERNRKIAADPELLRNLIIKEVLVQVNAGSLTGAYGQDIKAIAEKLVRHHMVHFLGSDAHSLNGHYTNLNKAVTFLQQLTDPEQAHAIISGNGKKLMDREQITSNEPLLFAKKKKIFSFLRSMKD